MPNKENRNTTWESFWKNNPTGFNSTMAQATLYFANTLDEQFPLQATDRVLDIGCGPGFLINYLKDRVEYVYGTDISEEYIKSCKSQFAGDSNTKFSVSQVYDFETYNHLIVDHKINRVIMLSVLQYYQSENDVVKLIESFKKIASIQHFSCLLADIIPSKHSTIADILSIIKHAIRRGYTFKFAKFLIFALFSDYRKMKKVGLLQLDESFFATLGKKLGLKIRIIKNLTVHTDRYSVLIEF